jgi:hypothetical protein
LEERLAAELVLMHETGAFHLINGLLEIFDPSTRTQREEIGA